LACRYLESRQIEEFASTAGTPFWRVCCVAHQWDTYTMSPRRAAVSQLCHENLSPLLQFARGSHRHSDRPCAPRVRKE